MSLLGSPVLLADQTLAGGNAPALRPETGPEGTSGRSDSAVFTGDVDMCLPISLCILVPPNEKPRRGEAPAGATPEAASRIAAHSKSTDSDRGLKARPTRKL